DEPAPLRPRVRRGTDTARASGAYGDAVAEARGEVIVVHLRRASVGLALTPENTHPFVEGEVTFSHNGQFDLSDQLRTRILARGGRAPSAPRTPNCSSRSSPRGRRRSARRTAGPTGRSRSRPPPRGSTRSPARPSAAPPRPRTVPLARHRVGGAAPPAGRPGRLGARDPARRRGAHGAHRRALRPPARVAELPAHHARYARRLRPARPGPGPGRPAGRGVRPAL